METMQRWSFTLDFIEPHTSDELQIEDQNGAIHDFAYQLRQMIEDSHDLQRTLAEHGMTLVMGLSR